MKFDQLIEYNVKNIFLPKIMQKMRQAEKLVPDPFLLFNKAL